MSGGSRSRCGARARSCSEPARTLAAERLREAASEFALETGCTDLEARVTVALLMSGDTLDRVAIALDVTSSSAKHTVDRASAKAGCECTGRTGLTAAFLRWLFEREAGQRLREAMDFN